MSNRVVKGTIKRGTTPLNSGVVKFKLTPGSFTETETYVSFSTEVVTNEVGEFEVELWCNEEGEIGSVYECTLPDNDKFIFVLPVGEADINITTLRQSGVIEPDSPAYNAVLAYIEDRLAEHNADEEAHPELLGNGDYAPTIHIHSIGDVTGLQSALNGKSDSGHGHLIGSVDGLQTALDNKAPAIHSHAINTVIGLTEELAGKSDTDHEHGTATTVDPGFMSASDKTKLNGIQSGATANNTDAYLLDRANHTGQQAISSVTGLQAAIDGKAATTHAHVIADITGLQTALDNLEGGGSGGTPTPTLLVYTVSQSSVGNGGHTGTYANLTDGSFTTGAGTASGFQWIMCDLGTLKVVTAVALAGGNLAGWDANVASYINARSLQGSFDGTVWTNMISSISDAVNNAERTWSVPMMLCRYVRLYGASYVGATTFKVYGY